MMDMQQPEIDRQSETPQQPVRRRRRRTGWILPTLIFLVFLGAVGVAVQYVLYRLPYDLAMSAMPENSTLTLKAGEDGTLLLKWPAGKNADFYLVDVLPPAEDLDGDGEPEEPEPLFSAWVEGEKSCELPALADTLCSIRIRCGRWYGVPGQQYYRMGENYLEVTGPFVPPTVENFAWQADAESKLVDVSFEMADNETCEIVMNRGRGQMPETRTLEEGKTTYSFGDGGQYPLLSFEERYTFSCQVCRTQPGLVFYGPRMDMFDLIREDLLGTVLKLQCEELGDNVYTLRWNETKGDHYVLQMKEKEGEWETLCEVPQDGEYSFTTGHLTCFKDYHFRILAVGGQTLPGSDYAATPDETQVTTVATPVFCTVWPLQDLTVYADTEKTEELGTAPEATAYCVLSAEGDWFYIRFGDGYGYIDNRYCMIDLAEYLGDIITYDITNSYDSLYMVHEYEISQVTGKVIRGYENVRNTDGSFLVPLLYPTAQKLEAAAFDAMSQGYRLKIYDAFRPGTATRLLYSLADRIMEDPVPDRTYTGRVMTDLPKVPSTDDGTEPAKLTYYRLMTDNGRYGLSYFLAWGTSMHNLGIAVDLTLETADGREELSMQTSMHDLSFYSEVGRDNSSARLLNSIMKNAGFGGLGSEWWHFQDNEARNDLNLKSYLQSGVSPACWMLDDNGWRYRLSDGSYCTGCTEEIDGATYVFDDAGYLVSE